MSPTANKKCLGFEVEGRETERLYQFCTTRVLSLISSYTTTPVPGIDKGDRQLIMVYV